MQLFRRCAKVRVAQVMGLSTRRNSRCPRQSSYPKKSSLCWRLVRPRRVSEKAPETPKVTRTTSCSWDRRTTICLQQSHRLQAAGRRLLGMLPLLSITTTRCQSNSTIVRGTIGSTSRRRLRSTVKSRTPRVVVLNSPNSKPFRVVLHLTSRLIKNSS